MSDKYADYNKYSPEWSIVRLKGRIHQLEQAILHPETAEAAEIICELQEWEKQDAREKKFIDDIDYQRQHHPL